MVSLLEFLNMVSFCCIAASGRTSTPAPDSPGYSSGHITMQNGQDWEASKKDPEQLKQRLQKLVC